MRYSGIYVYVRCLRIISTTLLVSLLLTHVSGCAEVPISALSKPHGIGTEMDAARNDANVFFFEDFEDENYENHFGRQSHSKNRKLISGNVVFNGKKSLRISVDRGENYGSSLNYRFIDAGMDEPTELYARYYLRFDDSWNVIKGGGKLPGPAGRYNRGGWGGRTSDGTNGWSARMKFGRSWFDSDHIDVGYYTYHANMSGKYGDIMHWSKDNRGTLQKNRWYCIETYVKLNTIGNSDGILRGWVDGYLAMEDENITFRTSSDLKVEEFWINIYYGGGWQAPNNMHLYIDNLVLSTHRIGTTKGQEN